MEVPGELTCRNRVRTLFTVGEGSPSSSESPVPSALGIRSPSVPETGFRREVEVYARSGPAGGSGGHEKGCSDSCRDAARDAARDVEGVALEVVGATSNIMQSGGEESRAWDLPFPESAPRSGICRRTEVRDLSGVCALSRVRRTGD